MKEGQMKFDMLTNIAKKKKHKLKKQVVPIL